MRQGDGSDVLGPGDRRSAEIGILYVEPDDSRQEVLTAINAQELQGRKQIAIVLPERGKAFRQPVEFDGLKNMRRALKAQLIFIAPAGPGPAEFARHRRFAVYSSLDTFKEALRDEGASLNPRARSAAPLPTPAGEKKAGLFGLGGKSKGRKNQPAARAENLPPPQNPPAGPPPAQPPPQQAPRGAPVAPIMPVIVSTPSVAPRASVPAPGPADARPLPPGPSAPPPIEEIKTVDLPSPAAQPPAQGPVAPPPSPRQGGPEGPGAPAPGEGDDDLAPTIPRTPKGSTARPANVILFPTSESTPRPAPSPATPTAQPQGPQTQGSGRNKKRGGGPTAKLAEQGKPAEKNDEGNNAPAIVPVAVPVGAVAGSGAGGGSSAPVAGPPVPAPVPATASATGTPGRGTRVQTGLTPLPIAPDSRRTQRRRRRRLLLIMLLALLILLLASVLLVNALSGPGGLTALGHTTATVTLTPNSHAIQNNYLLTGLTSGTPDPAQRQVSARVITAQSATEKGTANATGSIPARRASGKLVFQNVGLNGLTLGTTTLTGNDGVQVIFYGPVFVPGTGSTNAIGYAVNAGSAGNIKAGDIHGNCCAANIFVNNVNDFTGGQDPQPNSIIQQSDIDSAAKPLVDKLTTSTRADMQKQVKSNERVVDGSLQCPPTINANHRAGDVAKSVEVSVTLKCSEEVFDYAGAQKIASDLLPTNLPANAPNLTDYKLIPPILTGLVSAGVVSGQGQVAIQMTAAGKWVYQVSATMQQQIKQALVKHSKADALNILRQYPGLASADINISGGNTMPDNPNDITLKIVPVGGLQSLPTPIAPVPTVTPTPSPTPADPPQTGS